MITTWSTVDLTRLAADKFWPSELTLDMMLRDWGGTETDIDFAMAEFLTSALTATPAIIGYIGIMLPAWALDSGFGTFNLSLSLSFQMKAGRNVDTAYVKVGSAGTESSVYGNVYATVTCVSNLPYTTLPTGFTSLPIYGRIITGSANGDLYLKRPQGLAVDSWKVSIT